MQETINKVNNVFNEFNKRSALSLKEAAELINLGAELQGEHNKVMAEMERIIKLNQEQNKTELKPVVDKKK